MNKAVLVLSLVVAAGCTSAPPVGVDESTRPEIQAIYEAWSQGGMGDVSTCGAQHWARVSPEEFKDVCGEYSCQHSGAGSCMLACTPTDDVATAYWDETAHPNDPGAESLARAHEQIHAWLQCTTGSADANHTSRAWSLLKTIEPELRAMGSVDPGEALDKP